MPLIIITGLPCSGKSYRTEQIASNFSTLIVNDSPQSKKTIQVVRSHHASLDRPEDKTLQQPQPTSLRDQIYNSAAEEKRARAEEFSAIKRAVSKDNIVLADGLNYIKGYRYQLWCEAKAAGTRCCVVHVAAQEDECRQWNRERLRVWAREGEDEQHQEAVRSGRTDKVGKDVPGNLVPESHTAIFGDRVVAGQNRSRDSSTEARNGEEIEIGKGGKDVETMTLTSLYIHDDNAIQENNHRHDLTKTSQDNSSSTVTNSSSITPPPQIPIPQPNTSHPYASSTLSSLFMRYEPPSPFSRWDTPLFTIPTSDSHPPYDSIWAAIFPTPTKQKSAKALSQSQSPSQSTMSASQTSRNKEDDERQKVKPHTATVLPTATSADALQILESTTQEMVKKLLVQARTQNLADGDGEGGVVGFEIPSSSSTESNSSIQISVNVPAGVKLNQPMLQRIRRKYTQVQRGSIAHGRGYVTGGRKGVVDSFVRFLEAEFET